MVEPHLQQPMAVNTAPVETVGNGVVLVLVWPTEVAEVVVVTEEARRAHPAVQE